MHKTRPAPLWRPSHAVVALTLAAWLPGVYALDSGTSSSGVAYLSGGAGADEREAMQAQRGRYSLWLTTAARSGAFLADVEVRVTPRPAGAPVLEHRMTGPWLYAALPAGLDIVGATAAAAARRPAPPVRANVTIASGPARQLVLHFDRRDVDGN
ncbi:MAG: hypothetical protein ACO3ZK_05510 [Rubrivivax sp.]